MFIILTDSYDIVNCVAAFVPGHLKSNCIREMLKIVKPGKSSALGLSLMRKFLPFEFILATL